MIKITIPGIPPSINKWRNMHHFSEAKQKKHWEEIVGWEVKKQKVKPPTPLKKAIVIYRYYFKSKRRHDPDNYSGKWIMDGLVKSEILEDDSFDHVSIQIEQGGVDKEHPRIEIEIIEVTLNEK